MKAPFDFVIEPKCNRYNNTKKVGDKDLILNTEILNHQYINREAEVLSTPKIGETDIKPGDIVVVHHNIFRRWHDVKGKEKNSRSYINEDLYIAHPDQIYLYKRKEKWIAPRGYCFVQPIKQRDKLKSGEEEECIGIVKYTDGTNNIGDLVGFTPFSTYEFVIDGKRLYRVLNKFITIKYEYEGNEEAYNPSWAQSS